MSSLVREQSGAQSAEFFGAELLRQAATMTCKTSAGESADNAVMKESAITPPKPPRLAYHDQENDLRLYHGDCLDLLDEISAQYPDGCFDMVFADPPYFLSNNGSTCKGGERASVNKGHWDESGGLGADFKFTRAWLRRVKRALNPGGTIWVSGTQHSIQVVGFVLQSLKFRILNDITWEKLNPPPNLACRQFTHSTETLIWAARDEGADHIFNYDLMRRINRGSQMQSVWRMNAPAPDEKVFGDHPTQKPVALITRCLLAATCEGDWVFDPFFGSGTTAIACLRNRRRFVGIDLSGSYLGIAAARIRAESGQGADLFESKSEEPPPSELLMRDLRVAA
jgi:site-specific DNA-methyltransferase (adenine-specific)